MEEFIGRKGLDDAQDANRAFFRNRDPQSLHEARVMANAVRIEPGRYRVLDNTSLEVSHLIVQPTSTSRLVLSNDPRPRRPQKGYGDGQPLGKPSVSETPFSKVMEYMPNKPRKRVYFTDREEGDYDEIAGSPRKNVRTIKRVNLQQYKKYDEKYGNEVNSNESSRQGRIVGEHMTVSSNSDGLNKLDSTEIDDDNDGLSHGEYAEEVVDVMDDEQDHEGSMGNVYMNPFERNSIAELPSIAVGNVSIVKQLRGENNYLKDQLDGACYRIKQLETLLLERNQRLKQLLTENVQSSIKVQKLVKAIGVDEAATVLNPSQAKQIR